MAKKSAFIRPENEKFEPKARTAFRTPQNFETEEEKEAKRLKKKKRNKSIGLSVVSVCLVAFLVLGYFYWISPPQRKTNAELSSSYTLSQWNKVVNSGQVGSVLPDGSYLERELTYGNGNPNHKVFVEGALASVQYTIPYEAVMTIWDKPALDAEGNEVKTIANFDPSEELITIELVDWNKVQITDSDIAKAKEEVDYNEETLVPELDNLDLFLQIMADKINSSDGLPTKTIERKVSLVQREDGSWWPSEEEDITLDQELFSSEDLSNLERKFEQKMTRTDTVPDEANKADGEKAKDEKEEVVEPNEDVSEEWLAWNKLDDEKKKEVPEPDKTPAYARLPFGWVGAYNLMVLQAEEGSGPIMPQIGEGTKDSPAGLDTPVQTIIFAKNSEGKEVEYPIKIELKKFIAGQDALDYFESKDIRNRGLSTDSRMKLFAYELEITNLSKEELIVPDLTVLSDYNANSTGRTGVIYGLKESLKLKPGESGVLETWGGTVTPDRTFLIWGKDFNRRENPVWFRVLAAQDGEVLPPAGFEVDEDPQSE